MLNAMTLPSALLLITPRLRMQYMEVRKPLPTSGTLTNYAKIAGVYDKGKVRHRRLFCMLSPMVIPQRITRLQGALILLDVVTKDDKGEDVLFNQCTGPASIAWKFICVSPVSVSLFVRGLGGFGGDKGPKEPSYDPPQRAPVRGSCQARKSAHSHWSVQDVVHREQTLDNQAALYRLAGDRNPLHIDPAYAPNLFGAYDLSCCWLIPRYSFAGCRRWAALISRFCTACAASGPFAFLFLAG